MFDKYTFAPELANMLHGIAVLTGQDWHGLAPYNAAVPQMADCL